MKVRLLACGGVFATLLVGGWIYGNSLIVTGERESKWIVEDMWGENYFDIYSDDIELYERVNFLSLRNDSSKNQKLISYVVKNKCNDSSVSCYLVMTAASNLLIDGEEYDSGLKGAVEAYGRVRSSGLCPIAYESAVLKYKIKSLSAATIDSALSVSKKILDKIRLNGGLVENLRTEACIELLKIRPEYFHEYVGLIAEVMEFAGGDIAIAGAYIDSIRNERSGMYE